MENIVTISKLINDFTGLTNNYEFNYYSKQNNLTFEDVYLLAREIIESIDKNYLIYYDKILENGQLDFCYENINLGSNFFYNLETGERAINLNRNFNYTDICALVHEFIHYMNCLDNKLSINRYLLTEFISIYFEEYAKKYLLNKGISKEELFLNERIIYTKKSAASFNWYSLIILSYEKSGLIDENTFLFLKNNYVDVSKDDFEEECQKLLSQFEQVEKEYKIKIMYEKNFDEGEMFEEMVKILNINYRYVLGTILSYYALEHSSLEKMVYLCNHINDEKYAKMSLSSLLKIIDINLDDINLDIVEKKIIENSTKKMNK